MKRSKAWILQRFEDSRVLKRLRGIISASGDKTAPNVNAVSNASVERAAVDYIQQVEQ